MNGSRSPAEDAAAALVRRIAAGDRRAEGQLVELYGRGLGYLLRHLTSDPATSEDLYQETFRIVLEKVRGGGVREPGKLAGFIRGTARNLCRSHYRRPKTVDVDDVADPADPAPSALDDRLQREDRQRVRRLLGDLASSRDRQLLLRFYIAEEPKEQVCAALGLSRSQFNVAIFRARQRFKKLLEGVPGSEIARRDEAPSSWRPPIRD